MKPKKKNKFFTFCFSFMPGAAEMYIGFSRMGLSLMVLFLGSGAVASLNYHLEFILFASAVVWFFSFFHARNLQHTTQEEFDALQDHYIWEEFLDGKPITFPKKINRKWAAAALILVGASMLLNGLTVVLYSMIPVNVWDVVYPLVDRLPGMLISVLIIMVGIKLIRGKQEQLALEAEIVDPLPAITEAAQTENS